MVQDMGLHPDTASKRNSAGSKNRTVIKCVIPDLDTKTTETRQNKMTAHVGDEVQPVARLHVRGQRHSVWAPLLQVACI